jgi:polyisoprenoid-binding protein YceI
VQSLPLPSATGRRRLDGISLSGIDAILRLGRKKYLLQRIVVLVSHNDNTGSCADTPVRPRSAHVCLRSQAQTEKINTAQGAGTERKISMKRLALVTGILALAAPLALAQTSTWVSDQAHSQVEFTIRHMTVSNVHGGFGKVAATIVYNEADVTKSTVSATIDVSTVDTGVSMRDNDLKGAGLFDVANFPTATFTSTSVVKDGSKLKITGNFTLHGVTNPIVLEAEGPAGPVPGMDHKPHAGFSASTTISRSAFGVGTKYPAAMLGDDIKLDIELEVVKQ